MENVESSGENGSQPINPENLYIDLNNPEILQTVRDLKNELQTMKQDKQIILELNEYLLDKMNKQEKDKRRVIETDSDTSYKHKGKRGKYHDSESSSEIKPRPCKEI